MGDSHGRNQLAGYGSWAIPMAAGSSEVMCRCWRPSGPGLLGRLRAFLLGIWPELHWQGALTTPSDGFGVSRGNLKTEDSVDVLLRLNVIHQHFAENGLEA